MLIGLTGNIGSGKSSAARQLAGLGAAVIHADSLGHDVLLPRGPAYGPVLAAFGVDFLDSHGRIDRRKLGKYVFSDPTGQRLRRLEAITHPLIIRRIDEQLEIFRQQGRELIVLEAALLFNTPLQERMDEIWVVTAPRDILLQRVMKRDGCDLQTAEQRLNKQMPPEQMVALAHRVVVNDGTPQQLRKRLMELVAQVRH